MSLQNTAKQRAAQKNHVYKTRNDFLRWLRQQDTHKQQVAGKHANHAAYATWLALMVWADEGGSVG